MGGIALGILLKCLGFGKMLMGWFWDAVKGICRFATNKPFQFLVIVLSMALCYAGWYAASQHKQLDDTRKIVDEKVLFIKGQDKILKEYIQDLNIEKKNHVSDIRKSNDAVAGIKHAADAALARAQAAGRQALKDKVKFDNLATVYGRSNVSTGTADERIKREQATNDSFIKEWKKAQ